MQVQPMSKTRGFTLVEIIVVLAIIGILITISVVVAGRVTQGGRVHATEHLLKVLDSALTSYMADREGKVPPVLRDDSGKYFPLWDGRENVSGAVDDSIAAEPSLALFLLHASEVPAVDQTLKGIDSKYIRQLTDIRNIIPPTNQPYRKNIGGTLTAVKGYTILDAWGRPIRFVHPAWDGGGGEHWDGSSLVGTRDLLTYDVDSDGVLNEGGEVLRRSYRPFNPNSTTASKPVGDADEGICINNRPYFYSAGPDGDPGTRGDNVYSVKPTFPPETEKLN